MNWIISGPITVSLEVVDTESGARRNVVFAVPATDTIFAAIVTRRWRTSFAELAWQASQTKET